MFWEARFKKIGGSKLRATLAHTYNFVPIVVILDVEKNRPPMCLARIVESVVN